MTGPRSPGRYNLHRLGWSAFEDLCMQVMRVVLGETCTRFRPGYDQGRDGWFEGKAAGLLASEKQLTGRFVIQCKHTSSTQAALSEAGLKTEVAKMTKIAAVAPCHYLVMTNRQVTAPSDAAIRDTFEAIPGVTSCHVFNESWIEDTIDANPRLLRLVPRLYGIGDLSQILSFALARQTEALLEDLAHSLRAFVPTDSYRRAERALHEHGFVVLVGPPASGKSAIAANLCLDAMAQDPDARVMRIEHSEQFKSTWSPDDAHTTYWVDDVFGETTLDEPRLREWSAALEKVEAARRRQARIIFCTRDYILTAAERKLKKNKADFINDARVRVNVTEMSASEREAILYNYVKDGDITREQKTSLKRHLASLARLPSFTPELARRLGSRRFHTTLRYEWKDLFAFFDQPVHHFRDVIHGLSGSETAALAVCLLSGNAVPDPVPDNALAEVVLKTYGVNMPQVREAFELLEGSLVKRVRQATAQTWQVHHPSMIEALQRELAEKSSQLMLYLQGANLSAILRDTTTLPPAPDTRLVFLSDAVYDALSKRFGEANEKDLSKVGEYLVERASDALLLLIDREYPALLDDILELAPEPDGVELAARLAARLKRTPGGIALTENRCKLVEENLREVLDDIGWAGFLEVDEIADVLPSFVQEFLSKEAADGFPSLDKLYWWYAQDLSAKAHVDAALDGIGLQAGRMRDGLAAAGLDSAETQRSLAGMRGRLEERLHEKRDEINEQEDRRADYMQDEAKERWREERHEMESGRFADVDE